MGSEANWHILASTMIRALSYDPDTRELRVRFSGGGTYRYQDVPPEVAQNLIEPPDGSHGRYFNDSIRDVYDYEEEPLRH